MAQPVVKPLACVPLPLAPRPVVYDGRYSHNGLEIAQDYRDGKTTDLWYAVTSLFLAKTSSLKVSCEEHRGPYISDKLVRMCNGQSLDPGKKV